MKRGEIWKLQDKNYASKARPVVIIQDDSYSNFDSVILCLFTTYESAKIDTRVLVEPSVQNGLHKSSYIMTDKIVTVDKSLLGERIGCLSDDNMKSVSQKLRIVLGL